MRDAETQPEWPAWRRSGGALREAVSGRQALAPEIIETIFQWNSQAAAVGRWASTQRLRSVVLADFGKNLYATWRACHEAGLRVVAVADGNPAFAGMSYRGVPIVPLAEAFAGPVDGCVISNVNPAQLDKIAEAVRKRFGGPVLRLWEPVLMGQLAAAA